MGSAEIAQRLRSVLSQFTESQNPGEFKLVRGETALHVLPAHSAILERRISVEAVDTPAANALTVALDKLADVTRDSVGVWTVPLNIMKQPITIAATNEPAFEVISRLLNTANTRLSWKLVYDVNVKSYFMTIYVL